ncbi:hypothetical protein [Polaribacter sp. IC073]|uniref:hypothetical protein n=1 Tax=Polaribacter sp. IC073 TaxID=2508540 RepID=UPI0011BD4785|nr:hypothetical protein [Polaribacter sp. IC073]TXD45760.1 hypothetical protein ES045_16115 [Polaribacter sp. IC073]
MKKLLFVIILFTSLKNYSQEIQFVKEYDKVNYKDTDGNKIDKLAKSYVYFYNKGKVKVKIINSINLTLFLTEINEKELIGTKTTFFKGIDNKENKIRGFYTEKSFSILSDTSTLILNKEEPNSESKNNISYKNNNYCNERFSFCIEYPKGFLPNGESGNGDGQSFYSKDRKTKISSWGNLVIEDFITLKSNFERDKKNKNITYSNKRENYYVISGIENGKIFYQKTLQKKINYLGNNENTDILITYKIEYPQSQKNEYDYYCNKINNELK